MLWSDGAAKDRWLGLPEGTQVAILDDGDLEFPIGTVLRKDFEVAGTLVETRLFMRHDDGTWAGYTYEWNDAGTDAALVDPAGKTKPLDGGLAWTYPSRNGCMSCHSAPAGFTLGPELAQLDGALTYAATGRRANQLATWDAIGLFATPLPGPGERPAALAAVDDAAASVEAKARAYLHVNCSNCHRPGGVGAGNADMRAQTAFASMNLCNANPTEGDLGVAGARRLVPGSPETSLVSIRMKRQGAGRMPLLGTVVVDDVGTGVIDGWIDSIAGCP